MDNPAPTAPALASPDLSARCSYSPLVQLMAVIGVPLGRRRWEATAIEAGLRDREGRVLAVPAAAAALDEAVACGHAEVTPYGVRCAPQHAFAAFREAALTEGRLHAWQRSVLAMMDSTGEPPGLGRSVAAIRFALCAALQEPQIRALLARYLPTDADAAYWAAFGAHFDVGLANQIHETYREPVAQALLRQLLRKPQASAHAILEWVRPLATGPLRHAVWEHLLWQGRTAQVEQELRGEQGALALAFRGACAALDGDWRRAVDLYAQAQAGLRVKAKEAARSQGLRGKARLDIPPLPDSLAFLRVAALVAGKDTAGHTEAERVCRQQARAAREPVMWDCLRIAIHRLATHDTTALDFGRIPGDAMSTLARLSAVSWARVPTTPAEQEAVRPDIAAFASGGYERAACELEAGLALAQGKELEPAQRRTVTALFAAEPAWVRAIAALEAAAGPPATGASEDTRLVWIIHAAPARGVHVEAREQKRGARGWSSGRLLTDASAAKSPLLAQDKRVFEAMGRSYAHGYSSDGGTHRALAALVGHPRVFFAEDPSTPVTLTSASPELLVERRDDGGVRLALPQELRDQLERARSGYLPMPDEACVLLRDSATHVRVVGITRTHRRIAALLGPGLELPAEGVETLKRTLGVMATHFQVHTDVEAAVAAAPADARIYAALTPSGSALRLRLWVRPFGEAGPTCTPGTGGQRLLAQIGGERRAAVRDLAAERERLARVLEQLSLPDPDSESDPEWTLADPEASLRLVEALQCLGEEVRVEWPAGKPIRLTRAYRMSDLRLSVGGASEWLTFTGGLTLDEGTVLQMRTLIELARASAGRYLPLGEAGFLTLTEDLRRRIEELARLGELEGEGLRVPALAAGVVASTLEGATLESGAEWRQRIQRLQEAQALDPEPPSTLQAQLRPYQLDGFRWLARLAHSGAGACLADDMGLGKTVQAIAVLLHRAPDGAALVLAPTSVCANWADEIHRFAPTLKARTLGAADREGLIAAAGAFDVIICSYGLLPQVQTLLGARAWHTLVLDEAQAVKNFSTQRAKAVLALHADFRLATTGTPVENRLDELWMLFHFLNPGLLGSRERFGQRFAGPIERHEDERARVHLRKLTAPFMLRRTKAAVLGELPERTEITLNVAPSPREQAFHAALRDSALEAIADPLLTPAQRRFRVLAELMRVRRACCDPRLVAPEAALEGAKLETFAELAQELAASRHKALVFSQFVDYLQLLRARLDALHLDYQYLDGSTPAPERARSVQAFQAGEGDFFLISLRAGGLGLNLTAADYVVICDPWWNPAVEEQAVGRAHRMGQQRPVTVYRLVVEGSVEERIMALHRQKRALAEGLFSGESFGQSLSLEELAALLRGED